MKIPRFVSVTFSFIIVIGILVLPFLVNTKKGNVASKYEPVSFSHSAMIGNKPITVALATTSAQHEQGLSGTKELSVDQGMLFIFDSSSVQAFWMKEMNYPLDIIWIDATKKVVGVSENLDPKTYPQTFSPLVPVQYVLEVNSGFYKENNIKVGDLISF